MNDLRDQAVALRGTRVRATFAAGMRHLVVTGVLRFVTPKGDLIFAGEGGHDEAHPLAALMLIEDARHECPECHARVNRVFPGREDPAELCVDCSGRRARALPPPVTPCEDCGADGFRSPVTDKFRCASCHAKAKTLSGLAVERRVMQHQTVDCRSADIHSDLHDWKKVRGNHVCRKCQVKTHLL